MFGEVYICQFPFTSGVPGKIRPALVLFELDHDAIICRITSVARANPLDVVSVEWRAAGLLRPSVARLDRIITAERSIFLRRLGVLAPVDATAIRNTWNHHMRL